MKTPLRVNTDASPTALAGPAVIVILMLLLGATVYLWRQRYMRRRTAYVMIGLLSLGIVFFGLSMYNSGLG